MLEHLLPTSRQFEDLRESWLPTIRFLFGPNSTIIDLREFRENTQIPGLKAGTETIIVDMPLEPTDAGHLEKLSRLKKSINGSGIIIIAKTVDTQSDEKIKTLKSHGAYGVISNDEIVTELEEHLATA